jgi:hypothetical protein
VNMAAAVPMVTPAQSTTMRGCIQTYRWQPVLDGRRHAFHLKFFSHPGAIGLSERPKEPGHPWISS